MFLLLLACAASISSQYERAREDALTIAEGRPDSWEPDVALGVSNKGLQTALDAALDVALGAEAARVTVQLPLGITAEVRPRLHAERVRVRPSTECPACFSFDASVVGPVEWKVGPATGKAPVNITVGGVVGLDIRDGNRLELTPRRLRDIKVEAEGGMQFDLDGVLQDQVRAAFKDHLPPINVTEIDTSALPIRDLRLRTDDEGAILEVLSDIPGASEVPRPGAPKDGVQMVIAEGTLTGMLRRAAFEAGPLAMDVAVDPRALHVEGTRFTLDLRLWRLSGAGWWRDYTVVGDLRIEGKQVKLVPTGAEEVGQSRGAVVVDPLAALFEGKILDALVGALDRSMPARGRQQLKGVTLDAEAWTVEGKAGALYIGGELVVVPPT